MVDKEKTLSQIREGVCGLGEIKLAYVFGSFLQGERFNDIDVAIVTGPHDPHDERAAVRIARELERKMEPRIGTSTASRTMAVVMDTPRLRMSVK